MQFNKNYSKTNDFFNLDANVIPRTAKENKNKQGQKKHITPFLIDALYNVPLHIDTFRRVARIYYNTKKLGSLLFLTSDITKKCVVINFTPDALGYIILKVSNGQIYYELETKKPRYNSCLFKKLLKHKLFD